MLRSPHYHRTRSPPLLTFSLARNSNRVWHCPTCSRLHSLGQRSSPVLEGDPYHPDAVNARISKANELYGGFDHGQAAETLGYSRRISPQKAPFDSHGQPVYFDGKNYITPDIDGHNVTNGWKKFSRQGDRLGTYDSNLNRIKD
ncbi:MAG: hypothetical protein HEQ39_05360 [Rhizobacter sp.]